MAEKFDKMCEPALAELRSAIAAVGRAKSNDYPPHVDACLEKAQEHALRAFENIRTRLRKQ